MFLLSWYIILIIYLFLLSILFSFLTLVPLLCNFSAVSATVYSTFVCFPIFSLSPLVVKTCPTEFVFSPAPSLYVYSYFNHHWFHNVRFFTTSLLMSPSVLYNVCNKSGFNMDLTCCLFCFLLFPLPLIFICPLVLLYILTTLLFLHIVWSEHELTTPSFLILLYILLILTFNGFHHLFSNYLHLFILPIFSYNGLNSCFCFPFYID